MWEAWPGGRTLAVSWPALYCTSFLCSVETPTGNRCAMSMPWRVPGFQVHGLDHGIGHFMLVEVDSEAQAAVPPMPKSPQTLSAASDRKSAPQPSSHQAV